MGEYHFDMSRRFDVSIDDVWRMLTSRGLASMMGAHLVAEAYR